MASLLRPTAARAVHLRTVPRPANLGESREILRLISQFGEVEYFKNLGYEAIPAPNTALVIFKEEAAAQHCLNRSPLRFRMGKAPIGEQVRDAGSSTSRPAEGHAQQETQPGPPNGVLQDTSISPFGLGQARSMSTRSLPKPPPRPPQIPFQAPPRPLLESRIFQLQAEPARIHFRDHINMGHYHGRFMIDGKSIAQLDLARSVPVPGLSCIDWRAGNKPWRVIEREKERELAGPTRRKSLRELYDEGSESAATSEELTLPG